MSGDASLQRKASSFKAQMQMNSQEYENFDRDESEQLDFEEFCKLIKSREKGYQHSLTELEMRFAEMDSNGNGFIDLHEYLRFSMQDALARSAEQLATVFGEWDDDGGGTISKLEFRRAIKGMGFEVRGEELDKIFDEMDNDGSGRVDYKELEKLLRGGRSYGSGYVEVREAAAGEMPVQQRITLNASESVTEQLKAFLRANVSRVIDLFHDWDDDGDGTISKKNFRRAMPILGLNVSRAESDSLFDTFDIDGSGFIAYHELEQLIKVKKPSGGHDCPARPWVAGAVEASPLLETTRDLMANEFAFSHHPPQFTSGDARRRVDEAHWRWMVPMKGQNWMRQSQPGSSGMGASSRPATRSTIPIGSPRGL